MPRDLERHVREAAAAYGFELCAITAPDRIGGTLDRLRAFIERGYHGEMEWLAETLERRANPRTLWPDCRSIIMLAANYGGGREADPLARLREPGRGLIARYAKGRDYHDVVKGRLKHVAAALVKAAGGSVDVKVFVDTAPLMEKPLAEASGIGWQGKHTNLVSRGLVRGCSSAPS